MASPSSRWRGHGALEDIVVALVAGGGGVGLRQAEHVAEFGQEQRVVRALLPALAGPASGR